MDGEFGDEGLAGSRRRRDDDRLASLDGANGFDLEVIERERIARAESLEKLHLVTQ